jgi:hypothetical protein
LRTAIVIAALLHVVGIIGLLEVTTRQVAAPTYITLIPPPAPPDARDTRERTPRVEPDTQTPIPRDTRDSGVIPPFERAPSERDRTQSERAARPDSILRQRRPPPAVAVPEEPRPPQPGQPEAHELPPLAPGPAVGDGRIWVSPRPVLPAEVADALYGGAERDSVVVRRLRAMIDSLNEVLDEAQRQEQTPTWTRDVAGKKFGIDSQFIHVAGIKIPTTALALLPITLPQGNYGEMARSRQLDEMRDDLIRSAQRTETLADFRRYVKELRARKDAEREAARRAREEQQPQDTIEALP